MRRHHSPAPLSTPGLDLLGEIGRGAGSVVYRARRGAVDYAFKITDQPPADPGRVLASFRREATLLAGVRHPRLPVVHEVGQVDGRPYLVMDLFDGRPLAELVEDGPVDRRRAIALVLDVAEPLALLHARGLLHRDIKPQNIIVVGESSARLIDFGLAAHGGEKAVDGEPAEQIVGTLAYAAPEQSGVLARRVDHRSDLYSLGVVLFECLTGSLPFVAADAGELLRMHAADAAPDPRTLAPVGAGLAAVVERLLAKDPDDRYQNADDLSEHLRLVAADPDAVPATVDGGPDRQRPRGRLCGRESELSALTGMWREVRTGRGASCVISGASGMGLTRLADEVARVARGDAAVVLRMSGRDVGAVPVTALRGAIDSWLAELERLPRDRREEAYERIRGAAGSAASLVADLTPRLAAVLAAAGLPDADRQEQFAGAVAGFLADLARRHGAMLLVIDDATALDEATERILTRLLSRRETAPLMVLGTVCHDRTGPEAALPGMAAARATMIDARFDLPPLEDSGIADLVAGLLPGVDPGPRLGELLVHRGHGNPMITTEYLRAVVDAGLLSPHWGSWVMDVEGLDALDLPEDAVGIMLARLRRLDDQTRALLVVAAVLGTVFVSDVAAEVAGVDLDRAGALLAIATAEHLIEPVEHWSHRFVHSVIQQALLDGLGPAALADLHHAIAEVVDRYLRALPVGSPWIEEVTYGAAHHYLLGDPQRCGERAVELWRRAGERSLAAHEPARAVAMLERAATAPSTTADAGLLLLLATALTREGRHADARARLDEALAAETDPAGRARILLLTATVERAQFNRDSAIAAAERGLAELGRPLPSRGRPAMLPALPRILLGAVLMIANRGVGATGGTQRVHEALTVELHVEAQLACMMGGRMRTMRWHAAHAAVPVARLRNGPAHVHGLASLAVTAELMRLPGVSARLMARATAAAGPLADPQLLATLAWYRGSFAYQSGRDDGELWQSAVECHGSWMDSSRALDAMRVALWHTAVLGRVVEAQAWFDRGTQRAALGNGREAAMLGTSAAALHAAAGRPAEAAPLLRSVDVMAAAAGHNWLRFGTLAAHLHVLVEQGEFGPPFDEAVAAWAAFGARPDRSIRQYRVTFMHVAFGRLAQARAAADGDPAASRAALTAAERALRDLRRAAQGGRTLTAFAEVARAELALLRGRPDRALRTLARIRPPRQEAPVLDFERATAAARALSAAGHSAAARHQARIAVAVATDAGMVARARGAVREFGLRPATTTSHPHRSGAPTGSSPGGIDRSRLEALQEISRAVSRVLDFGELVRICLDRMLSILSAERAVLFLTADDDTAGEPLVPYLGRDRDGQDVPQLTGYSASLVERVRRTREPVVVTGSEEGAALGAESVVLHGLRSIMVAPLQLEGRLLGVVYLDSHVAKGIFTSDDEGILIALMTHIATALETARAAELEVSVRAARQQRDFAEGLRVALEEMAAATDPDDVLRRLTAAVSRTMPGVEAMLIPVGAEELRDAELRAVLDGRHAVTGTGSAPRVLSGTIAAQAAWSLHPLRTAERAVGLLVLSAAAREALSPTQLDLAGAMAGQAMTAYDRAALFARVQELAVVDELTGVANRRRFFEVAGRDLATARLHGRALYGMMIDIDHFKRVNDTYGHPAGDEVIRTVAQRLRRHTRDTDVLGRYGGEEFALVVSGVADAPELAERLRAAIEQTPVATATALVAVTASIGLTALTPDDAGVAELLARADAALYAAKRGGRNQVVIR